MSEPIEQVHKANGDLCAFQMRWNIDGDYIRCASCRQPQLSTYADKPFLHTPKCKFAGNVETHPWVTYLRLLQPIAAHLGVHRHSGGDGEAWRSIESAPRDGTEVLLWDDGEYVIALWNGRRWATSNDTSCGFRATHWKPLSAPLQKADHAPTISEAADALGSDAKDAARYRWLRQFPNNVRPAIYAPCNLLMREEYLDAAIDAARAGEMGEK